MELITIKNGHIKRKEYKTQMNLHKAQRKAVNENANFIAKKYDDGSVYIYNSRTNLFVKTR